MKSDCFQSQGYLEPRMEAAAFRDALLSAALTLPGGHTRMEQIG